MRNFCRQMILCGITVLLAGCGSAPPPVAPNTAPLPQPPVTAPAAPPAPTTPVHTTTLAATGLDASAIDKTTSPCSDFYQFACGGWIAHTEIPSDEAMWSRSFSEVHKRVEQLLHDILEKAAKYPGDDPIIKRLGQYYGSCMDEAAIEKAGIKPIQPLLAKAKKVHSAKELVAMLAELHQLRIYPLFDVESIQDFKDATRMIANLDQNGLGLPDRDYYTRDDDKSQQLRKTYEEHVQRMLVLGGMKAPAAKKAASDILALETSIAKISKTKVERRDPKSLYNPVDRAGLSKLSPGIDWDSYWSAIGFAKTADINVTSKSFFEGIDKLVKETKPEVWQNYLQWHILHRAAPTLAKAFFNESFSMQKALTGQPEPRPRWKRCISATDDAMGEALAQPFVKQYFGGDSKTVAQKLVLQIGKVFEGDVQELSWMDEPTKAKALSKRREMAYLIGYPDRWIQYDFKIDPHNYRANVSAANQFETKRDLNKVGKPVDRNEWQMSPPTVNAYYDPQRNHMVFPAGILQPPFYGITQADAVNYGAIGMVVGHELTHGFDDEGSQYDAKGNLENWWSSAVQDKFQTKTACVADQYSSYEALPGLKLNGKLTLGENIADLGGMKLSYRALLATRKERGFDISADGYTEDQLFFMAHAQDWCTNMRDDLMRTLVQTNPHSPAKFRVNGPLTNMPEFSKAFSCIEGTPMNPSKRCEVW